MMAGEPLHFHIDSVAGPVALGAVPIEASDSVVARVVLHRTGERPDTLVMQLRYPHRPPSPAPTFLRRIRRMRRTRRLRVDRRFSTRPDSSLQMRIARENERARRVGRDAHATHRLWTAPFQFPRVTRITSGFGTGRVFNGRVASSHSGVDFAGHTGDTVRAANRGVVALVDSFFLAGNVIYIDHGEGIVTGYFHLSRQSVAAGDTVERGEVIGLVGATGRVTGPHLHWSARYGTLTVDPMGLVELTGGSMARSHRRRARRRKGRKR